MFGRVQPQPKSIKEIKTPKNMIQELLVGSDENEVFSARRVQQLVRESDLTKKAGQTLYYPLRLTDLPEGVAQEERHVQEILMANYERLQTAVSDVLVERGCNLYCTSDPDFERRDLLGTGYSRLRGRSNLLLKEGNPNNPVPEKELVFQSCQHSIYERVLRCLGVDGNLKALKVVENLAGCEYAGETNNYTIQQNMQAIIDTMEKTASDHASNNVHRDIKPEHIFIVPTASRRLGIKGKRCDQETRTTSGMLQPDPDTNIILVKATPHYADIAYYDYHDWVYKMNIAPIDVFSYGVTLLSIYLGVDHDQFMEQFHKEIKSEENGFMRFNTYIADIRKEDILKTAEKTGTELDIPDRIFELIVSMLARERNFRPHLQKVIKILKEEFDLEDALVVKRR